MQRDIAVKNGIIGRRSFYRSKQPLGAGAGRGTEMVGMFPSSSSPMVLVRRASALEYGGFQVSLNFFRELEQKAIPILPISKPLACPGLVRQ